MRDDSQFESESATTSTSKPAETTGASVWRRRAATGAGALMSLVILGAVVIWSYRLGVRDATDIPVIRAELGLTKERPADTGGEVTPHQDRAVFEVLTDGETAPAPKAGYADAPDGLADEDTAPIAAAPTPTTRPRSVAAPAGDGEAAAPAAPAPLPDPAATETADATATATATATAAATADGAAEAVGDAAPTPADEIDALVRAALAAETADDAETGRSARAPVAAPVALARPDRTARALGAARPETPEPREAARASAIQIQLGAFASEEIAAAQWTAIKERNGDLLSGRGRVITPVRSGGAQLFRLRAGPFDSIAQASALCRGLQKRGADCIVARAE